jgi:hypothetical protein
MLAVVIDATTPDLGSAVDLVAPDGTGTADELEALGSARVSGKLWAAGRAAATDLSTDARRCSPVQWEGEDAGHERVIDCGAWGGMASGGAWCVGRRCGNDACRVRWTAVGYATSNGRGGKKPGD